MNADDVKKMKVTELREALKARGLDTKGVKAVLVKRLERSIAQEAGEEIGKYDVNQIVMKIHSRYKLTNTQRNFLANTYI